jgi:ABC-type transport system involved in multi-copper enzyme maturation permease subunit
MSSAAVARAVKLWKEAPWQLWFSQLGAVLRIELKKSLWMRRSIWIYLLAFAPTVMFGVHALTSPLGSHCSIKEDTEILAYTFQIFYLRVGIFFGCMGLFTWLFRGEIVEKSLHYYFLSPMRRELLIVGKFLAAFITASVVFGLSVLLCFTLAYGHFGAAGQAFVFQGPGLGHLTSYLLVTVLACLGYGAIFLALSLLFKNPILPGAVVLLWESVHPVLPALLQKFSVTFYLRQLSPITVPPDGLMALFTVIAEPVSPWLAIPGLLILSFAILIFAAMRIRKTEISYLAD